MGLEPNLMFEEGEKATDVWSVYVRVREGMLPPRLEVLSFRNGDEAKSYADKHEVGKEVDFGPRSFTLKHFNLKSAENKEKFYHLFDSGWLGRPRGVGDHDSPLAYNVLKEAGLTQDYGDPSLHVLTFLGKQRVGMLKNKYGDNWGAAAVFEYCYFKMPESSAAFVAAAYKYHYYISKDDLCAGYLWRDLECIVHGVEAAAISTSAMRKKASKAGGEKSAIARDSRRSSILEAIEHVADRNPDLLAMGVKSVTKLALARSC